jgi:hypothetical protein
MKRIEFPRVTQRTDQGHLRDKWSATVDENHNHGLLKIPKPWHIGTVPLCESNLFTSGSCPILVLTTVLDRLRHANARGNGVKNYQGPTTCISRENAIRKYLNFPTSPTGPTGLCLGDKRITGQRT